MLIYQKTFENEKRKDCNFPEEDESYASENEGIIADGVTRDPIGDPDLSHYSKEDYIKKYPRPSGASEAAKIVCKTFAASNASLYERLKACNEKIKEYNDKEIPECDYLQNDYYASVASCMEIKEDILQYAYICDCGVIVYDHEGKIKMQTVDDKARYSDQYIDHIGIPWNLPEARVLVRKEFRNQPEKRINGECVSYGALTGEESALPFIRTGSLKLQKGDFVLLYSDGFAAYLKEKEFIKNLLHFEKEKMDAYIEKMAQENKDIFGRERTVLIWKIEE